MPKLRRLTAAVTAGALVALYGGATYASAAIINEQGAQKVTADLTPAQLAKPLAGPGVEISNASFSGSNLAAGSFSGFEDVLGFDAGTALSTGSVVDSADHAVNGDGGAASSALLGPNEHRGNSGRLLEPGINGDTFDGATLDFDFVAEGSQLKFSYVFASEDYPKKSYQNNWADKFSIKVNGENCALVPGTDTGVSAATINGGTNANFYKANGNGKGSLNTELDGLTTVLNCTADVTAGEKNTMSVSLADVGDDMFDTTVLMAAESLEVNKPPTAQDKELTLDEDTSGEVVLTGTDPNGDKLSYQVADEPEHGTVKISGNKATYTPDKNYAGKDSFTYVADDGGLKSKEATVDITVNPLPDPPTAKGSEAKTVIGEPVDIKLQGSDPDEGDELTYTIVTQPENGEVSEPDAEGKVTYTPLPNYKGEDSFTFTVTDSDGAESAPATVTISVVEPNHAPMVEDDSYGTDFGAKLKVDAPGVLANDSDPDGDDLTAKVEKKADNGTVELNADGSFTYTPDEGFSGEDTFTYVAEDNAGPVTASAPKGSNKKTAATSEAATVTITVAQEPNDPPTDEPTDDPTDEPTDGPTDEPTDEPTQAPTPPEDDDDGELGDTGSDVSPMMIAWGLMALVAGAGTLIAARKLR